MAAPSLQPPFNIKSKVFGGNGGGGEGGSGSNSDNTTCKYRQQVSNKNMLRIWPGSERFTVHIFSLE